MKKRIILLCSFLILYFIGNAQQKSSDTISLNIKNESNTITLIIDTIPPDIKFLSPGLSRGFKTISNTQTVELSGLITDRSEITYFRINNQDVAISSNGDFKKTISLSVGEQTVFVEAMDKYNNKISQKYTIDYTPKVTKNVAETKLNVVGKYYALLIGINNYKYPGLNDLDKPIADATRLQESLVKNYTFKKENITFLKNASRTDIIEALDFYSETIKPNDNFLIFYAGHGYWDDKAKIGYWIPSDAKSESKAAWFRNSTLRDYLKEINSKHTLLIADACFGGGIFRTRKAFDDAPSSINLLYDLPSRQAMTSGNLTEVPDDSEFMKFLIKRLNDNKNKYLSAEKLFTSFREAVINNSEVEVTPKYGEIKKVGDEGGEFIFIKR